MANEPTASTPAPATPNRDDIVAAAAHVAGLPANLAKFVQGDDLATAVQSARDLSAAIAHNPAPSTPEPTPAAVQPTSTPAVDIRSPESVTGGPERREPPHGSGWSHESIAKLAKSNPREFNRLLDEGKITLGNLR
jgi:hypothetical protein